MAPTYYVIELSARWLTALLVALALVMVLAFAFGYGAAWSVLSPARDEVPEPMTALAAALMSPTPDMVEEVIQAEEPTPTRPPTAPVATRRTTPRATPIEPVAPTHAATRPAVRTSVDGFWVQVLASTSSDTIERAAGRLDGLGFPAEHRTVTTATAAGGAVLHKLRVGPFPDRESADRVVLRMQASGFPDAWVVAP